MHSLTSCLVHCVFSTKLREPILTPPLRERLWPYLGGIARENGMKALAIGGVADHVHLLLSLRRRFRWRKAMQLLKGNSSKWLYETFPDLRKSGWQEGYAAFPVGVSGIDETVAYPRSGRPSLDTFVSRRGGVVPAQTWTGIRRTDVGLILSSLTGLGC